MKYFVHGFSILADFKQGSILKRDHATRWQLVSLKRWRTKCDLKNHKRSYDLVYSVNGEDDFGQELSTKIIGCFACTYEYMIYTHFSSFIDTIFCNTFTEL